MNPISTADAVRARLPRHRRGVTLLELLVVLVLLGISASLVVPAIRVPLTIEQDASRDDGVVTNAVDSLLADVRRLAIKRGQPVRFRIAADGVWAVVAASGGETIRSGRLLTQLPWLPTMTVDALGMCILAPDVAPRVGFTTWDALACRWRVGP